MMRDIFDNWDPDSEYLGVKLTRDSDGRVLGAFGSVFAKAGDRVRYLDKNGWDWQREEARKHFNPGDILTVSRVAVNPSSSKYWFKETGPTRDFNPVMFELSEPEGEA
jgi:hypothetical protein